MIERRSMISPKVICMSLIPRFINSKWDWDGMRHRDAIILMSMHRLLFSLKMRVIIVRKLLYRMQISIIKMPLFMLVIIEQVLDQETIKINLRHWDQPNSNGTVPVLCVVINIYSGSASFKNIRNCFARLIDDNNRELCRFNLTEEQDTEAMIMCHIEKRVTGLWGMSADGVGCSGRVAGKSASDAIRMLSGEGVNTKPLE